METFETTALSINFYLYGYGKEDRKTYPVYARLILHRKSSDISLKMSCKPDDWDFESGQYMQRKEYCIYANNKLMEERNKLLKAYFDLKKHCAKPSLKSVMQLFRGKIAERADMTLLSYYDLYVNEIRELPQQYGEGVIEHYIKTRRHLQNYLISKGWEHLTLIELSRNFIVGFEHYLLSTPNPQRGVPMNGNTATTYLRKLKAVVNNALKKEILTRNPFANYTMRNFRKTTRVYLTNEELDAIKKNEFGGNLSLQKARDFFLFSVYTGLRHSDTFNLKANNIRIDRDGVKWLSISQKKTKEPLEVPMLDQAVQLYDKYEEYRKETGYVLPRLCNQKINLYLKIIAELSGIDKVVSHHVARHTFATTITLQRGVEIKTVSKLMGQTSIASTEVYARVSPAKLLDTAKELNKLL